MTKDNRTQQQQQEQQQSHRQDGFSAASVVRKGSSASTLGVLAADNLESEIRLTRFGFLSNDEVQANHMLAIDNKNNNTVEMQQTNNENELSAGKKNMLQSNAEQYKQGGAFILNCDPTKNNNYSNNNNSNNLHNRTTNNKHNEIDDLKQEWMKNHSSLDDSKEQFQIVWRSLSFDVKTSAYDRFMNLTFDTVRALFRLDCLSESSNKLSTDVKCDQQNVLTKSTSNMSSTCALAINQQSRNSLQRLPKRSTSKSDTRNVFDNLNGFVRSGEISAILGPSGAGKTSLINALCGGTLDNYKGTIEVQGGGADRNRRMQMSIIPQKDYLIENLTVRENLLYSSQLLNTEKDFNHEENIMRVVKMLNLSHCFDSSAGNISGGEYKRVSIAQELLRQPDILVLDEPTSGLDSLNCKNLIRTLKHLIEVSKQVTMKQIAVVMTIHQPDIDIFNMFDRVYCMARRGRVIFDGHPSEVLGTLKSHAGFVPGSDNAPPELISDSGVNPANLLIEIASEDVYGDEPIERLARLQRKKFEHRFGSSSSSSLTMEDNAKRQNNNEQRIEIAHQSVPLGDELALGGSSGSSSPCSSLSKLSATAESQKTDKGALCQLKRDKRLQAVHNHSGKFWYHARLLTRRSFVSTLRDPIMTLVSLLFHVFVPVVMWIVYPRTIGTSHACPMIQRELDIVSMTSNQTMGKMRELQEELLVAYECSTMLFITAYALSMCTLTVSTLAFPLNMHILFKEVRNGWYDLKAFVLAKQVACLPFEVMFPAMTMILTYLMLDMPESDYNWRLWSMALVMAGISIISNTHGLIFGTLLMDSVQSAVFSSIASTLPQIMLSGFTVRVKWLPKVFQYLSWLSQYRYASEMMNMIRFGFGVCPCDQATDDYLQSTSPQLTDVPENLKSMFLYYLSSNTDNDDNNATATSLDQVGSNKSLQLGDARLQDKLYSMTLSQSERSELIARMEANEVDIFDRMAELMSRSWSYGKKITGCEDVRSQVLDSLGTNTGKKMHLMVGSLLGIIILFKIVLFLVVKYKIGNRI